MTPPPTLQPAVARGDVFYACLDPVVGAEIGKERPVVILQNDIGNRHSPTVICAAITAYSAEKASYPVCAAVEAGEGGLAKRSVVNCSQIRTLDRQRLRCAPEGRLPEATVLRVDEALRNSLAL